MTCEGLVGVTFTDLKSATATSLSKTVDDLGSKTSGSEICQSAFSTAHLHRFSPMNEDFLSILERDGSIFDDGNHFCFKFSGVNLISSSVLPSAFRGERLHLRPVRLVCVSARAAAAS